ncbi:MAG: ester cyclase [Pseudomonadota bacterium]
MTGIGARKAFFEDYRSALYDCDAAALPDQLSALCSLDCDVQLAHPLGRVKGPAALFETGYAPLLAAIPDLERRDYIVIGAHDQGKDWIGCGGYYSGVFERPWLDIPATRHFVHMRYIEFFGFRDDRISDLRLLWDIPAVMMQARAWPLAPSLGVELLVPGPASHAGIVRGDSDPVHSAASMKLVNDMINGLSRFAEGGPEAMNLEQFWHPKMNWYGPAGIGANRRLSGFRNWHQIPFLKSLPDRSSDTKAGGYDCYFADGDYVAFCGWPAMHATVSGDGWMGISPSNREIHFSSLDLWRCENGQIRENWVLIDLLDVWAQLGVDVLERMREVTFDRQPVDFKP